MTKIYYNSEFFNIKDTLECGQIFRFTKYENGYLVFSMDKCAFCYYEGDNTVILCEDEDRDYFYNFFDLDTDYQKIVNSAKEHGELLFTCAQMGKGIRILRQNAEEILFSFIISQNNNIPRIKGIIDNLCHNLGAKKEFYGVEYYGFPTAEQMAIQHKNLFTGLGLGYRAPYMQQSSQKIADGYDLNALYLLNLEEVKAELLKFHGVGPKVAECVALFGFHKMESFPVDTWIDKVYRENFNGTLKNRADVSSWFRNMFKENAGYFQQYLFYYKRSLEKTDKGNKNRKK